MMISGHWLTLRTTRTVYMTNDTHRDRSQKMVGETEVVKGQGNEMAGQELRDGR
jgi:hypothetical protein